MLAARAIWRKLIERFDGRTPTPQEILADDPDELRAAAGFSRAKVAYLRSLAEHVLAGELELDRLAELPDEEVIRELTAVKGIGEWTRAHVPDVHAAPARRAAHGRPRGAQRGPARVRARAAPPKPAEMQALAEPWRPYRTRACLYLWRSLANAAGLNF